MNYMKKKTTKVGKGEVRQSFMDIKKLIRENLVNEYKTTSKSYNKKVINDIIYNEKTQLVANFKEYLIFDDNTEFFKR
jgi:hypothetical protein